MKIILDNLSKEIRNAIERKVELEKNLEEIRIRVNQPIILSNLKRELYISEYRSTQEDIKKTFELMTKSSVYAMQEEIKQGFITLAGGHRVGIAGRAVLEGKNLNFIKNINSLNIRIAREFKGCADNILPKILINGNILNTLIVSRPQQGKTTILRDLTRQLSNKGFKMGLADERGEIAGCFQGIPQLDVGLRTDILDGCPKAVAMIMLVRAMSPHIIVTDEIGTLEDIEAIKIIKNCGVKIISSIHGETADDTKHIAGLFDKVIYLNERGGTV